MHFAASCMQSHSMSMCNLSNVRPVYVFSYNVRSQTHFRPYGGSRSQAHFDATSRYPSNDQLDDSNTNPRVVASSLRVGGRVGTVASGVSSTVSSPQLSHSRTSSNRKHTSSTNKGDKSRHPIRSQSASPSPSHSRSSSVSSDRSQSPSSSSNISSNSPHSSRSVSPSASKPQSPLYVSFAKMSSISLLFRLRLLITLCVFLCKRRESRFFKREREREQFSVLYIRKIARHD